MLIVDHHNPNPQRFNVVVNGKTERANVPKTVAESYVGGLDEDSRKAAYIVPITDDGKEVLFG
jgi:hypothetical protein